MDNDPSWLLALERLISASCNLRAAMDELEAQTTRLASATSGEDNGCAGASGARSALLRFAGHDHLAGASH